MCLFLNNKTILIHNCKQKTFHVYYHVIFIQNLHAKHKFFCFNNNGHTHSRVTDRDRYF